MAFGERGNDQYFTLQRLKEALPRVIVKGSQTVHRAVLNKVEDRESGVWIVIGIDIGLGLSFEFVD